MASSSEFTVRFKSYDSNRLIQNRIQFYVVVLPKKYTENDISPRIGFNVQNK